MDEIRMHQLAAHVLGEWNTHDVDRVVAVYTDDVLYFDPNTRGPVTGAEALRHYLARFFSNWRMRWTLREARLFTGGDGCAVTWHAAFQRTEGGSIVEIDGVKLVRLRGDLIARSEIYFDRTSLMPLLGPRR
ncbi:MAG: nuclear transport factor 2 family protein [bacterium]